MPPELRLPAAPPGFSTAAPESTGPVPLPPSLKAPSRLTLDLLEQRWRLEAASRLGPAAFGAMSEEEQGQRYGVFLSLIADQLGWEGEEVEAALGRAGILPDQLGPSPEEVVERRAQAISSLWDDIMRMGSLDPRTHLRYTKNIPGLGFGIPLPVFTEEGMMARFRIGVQALGLPFHAAKAAFLTMPRLGATGIRNPFFNPDAARLLVEDPAAFAAEIALRESYGAVGWRNPGAAALEARGMHPLAAEIVTGDIIDPLSYIGGKPLVWLAGGASWALGHQMVRMGRAARNGRVAFNPEIGRQMRLAAAASLGMDVDPPKPRFGVGGGPGEDLDAAIRQVEGADFGATFGDPTARQLRKRRPIASRMAQIQAAKARPLTRQQMLAAEKEAAKGLDKVDEWSRRNFLRLRMDQVNSQDELLVVERVYGTKYGADMPRQWFNKDALTEVYWDRARGKAVEMPAGTISDFARRPSKYIRVDEETGLARFRRNNSGRRLQRLLGSRHRTGPQAQSILQDFFGAPAADKRFAYMGRAPRVREMREAMEWLYKDEGLQQLTPWGYFFGRIGLRNMRPWLQNTGGLEVMVNAEQAAMIGVETRMAELVDLLGGSVVQYAGTDALSQMLAGTSGLRVGKTAEVLTKRGRDTQSRLILRRGGERVQEAVNKQRAEWDLPALTHAETLADATLDELDGRLKLFFQDMAEEAMAAGLPLTMDRILDYYLPIIGRRSRNIDQAVEGLDVDFRAAAKTDHAPTFAKARSGMIDPEVLDLGEMVRHYAHQLYFHKFVKPHTDDLIRVATDPAAAMGITDRAAVLNWLDVRFAGGRGLLRSSMGLHLAKMRRMVDDGGKVAAEIEEKFGQMLQDPGAWEKWARKQSTVLSNAYYVAYMGLKQGTAARNLTQKFLVSSFLGRGLPRRERKPYLLEGARRWNSDPAARARYMRAAPEEGWANAPGEFYEDRLRAGPQGLISNRARDSALFTFRWADMDNRAKVYLAAEAYVDDLWTNAQGGGKAFEALARRMRPSDRALFLQAFRNQNLDAARRAAGRFMVNETQWLYHAANRARWANFPVLGLAYLFSTWPMNFTEALIHAARTGGARGARWLPDDAPRAARALGITAGALTEAHHYLLTYALLGVGLDIAGRYAGMDLGAWFFPDMPGWMKEQMEVDEEETAVLRGGRVPIPVTSAFQHPALTMPGLLVGQKGRQTFQDVTGVRLGQPAALGALVNGMELAGDAFLSAMSDDRELSQRAVDEFMRSTPLRPMAFEPFSAAIGDKLGIPANPRRRNAGEKLLGGWFAMPTSQERRREGLVERVKRSQGVRSEQ